MPNKISSAVLIETVNDCIKQGFEVGEELIITVKGDCMQPVLQDSDQVAVVKQRRYLAGDIVAYYCPYHKQYFVHRLLGAVPFQQRYFIMADNASRPDVLVDQAAILGRTDSRVSVLRRFQCLILNYYWITASILRRRVFRIGNDSL